MKTTKPLQGRPVIFGEVLFDRFPDGTEVLGGAPFNVAWHLQGFGCAPLFVSRVGDDSSGERVRDAMQAWELDTAGLQVDAGHCTGLVDIRFEGQHHSFDILADRAYDHIDLDLSQVAVEGAKAALLYHGTLIIRTQKARQVLGHLLRTATIPVFVDVNLRDPWWRDEDLPQVLERASWVKVNDEELITIAKQMGIGSNGIEETARRFRATYELSMLIVTLGSRGALAFDSNNEPVRVEPEQHVEIIDTIGAGDAFSSVVLLGLLKGWPLAEIMSRAQRFASRVCTQRGATSEDLGLYQTMRS